MKLPLLLYIILLPFFLLAQNQYPPDVKAALNQTTTNKSELIKALDYFYKTGDDLKIASINFLISNMPIHNSYNYYWEDSVGHRIAYNELNYATFNDAVIAFNSLKTKHLKLHPVPYIYRDIDSVKGEYLIENIELAIESWQARNSSLPKKEDGSLGIFLEYVLPYRISIESLETWRKTYATKYSNIFKANAEIDSVQLRQSINSSFKNLWGIEARVEPLPRLSALQIQLREKGFCEDMADMAVFIARSQGLAATVDNIPFWATSSGNHTTNYLAFDNSHHHFDAALDSLGREPGKVLRTTYSSQQDAIATWLDTTKIPDGFLRVKNYKDVTKEYWPVANISADLFSVPTKKNNVVFLSVLNNGGWQSIWYAKINNGSAIFKNMGRGAVYLPMYYENNRLIPAGWPQTLGYNDTKELKPDSLHLNSITLYEQEKYLKFRPSKRYRLFMWNKQWQLLGEQTPAQGCTKLTFEKVPANALLILVPEYSQGKERPFTILKNGDRQWW
jgi:hypothetical protein